jgi:hypothetical protein
MFEFIKNLFKKEDKVITTNHVKERTLHDRVSDLFWMIDHIHSEDRIIGIVSDMRNEPRLEVLRAIHFASDQGDIVILIKHFDSKYILYYFNVESITLINGQLDKNLFRYIDEHYLYKLDVDYCGYTIHPNFTQRHLTAKDVDLSLHEVESYIESKYGTMMDMIRFNCAQYAELWSKYE